MKGIVALAAATLALSLAGCAGGGAPAMVLPSPELGTPPATSQLVDYGARHGGERVADPQLPGTCYEGCLLEAASAQTICVKDIGSSSRGCIDEYEDVYVTCYQAECGVAGATGPFEVAIAPAEPRAEEVAPVASEPEPEPAPDPCHDKCAELDRQAYLICVKTAAPDEVGLCRDHTGLIYHACVRKTCGYP